MEIGFEHLITEIYHMVKQYQQPAAPTIQVLLYLLPHYMIYSILGQTNY